MRLLEFHQGLLSDRAGQEAYRRAIEETLRGGETVLDLGTGTGIHALFACRAGARKVYAVDEHEFIQLARQVARSNGCHDRIHFLHGFAQDMQVPEPVDVIVAHMGLSLLFELLPTAREHFLRAGGTLIPASVELFCVPLEAPGAYQRAVEFWDRRHFDLCFAPIRSLAVNSRHDWNIAPQEMLAPPIALARYDFASIRDPVLSFQGETVVGRPGTLHGVGVWFVLGLTPHVSISTAPPCSLPTTLWANKFLPIETPVPVEPGCVLNLDLRTGAGGWGELWNWRVVVHDRNGRVAAQFTHSSFFSHLATKEGLRKRSPDYQPDLTPRGAAVRFVLEACDGKQPLAWIEQEVATRFPELFATPGEGAGVVARVVAQYCK